ncbi:MAG: flippase-like domain-containing protein [Candidatus Rokuibacteriota bacterium]
MLGVVLLAALVAQNDPAAVLASIADLSWRLVVIMCFPAALVAFFDTLGWRYAFLRQPAPFGALTWARLAGEAFNMTTPTAAVGGEAVKAWLLRGHAPLDATLASVIVAKTTITLGQGLYFLLGVVVAWEAGLGGSPLFHAMLWFLAIEAVALTLFVLVQMRGMLGWTGRVLERLGLRPARVQAMLGRVDDSLGAFYRTAPGRLGLSIWFHFVAWLLGSVETWLILKFLGIEVSLATATVIEAFSTGVKVATFLVPASLGVLEGGFVATFAVLGLSSTAAISFSLVRRLREAVWVAIGLIAFAVMRPRGTGAPDPPRS